MSKRAVMFVAATAVGAWWLAGQTGTSPPRVGSGSYSLPRVVVNAGNDAVITSDLESRSRR